MDKSYLTENLRERTDQVLMDILVHNQLDMSEMTEDGTWFVGTAAVCLRGEEIQRHLDTNFIDLPVDKPEIRFTSVDFLGEDCVSVAGRIGYHASYNEKSLIKISFFASWVCIGQKWKLKQLVTTSRRDEDLENRMSPDTRIDMDILYDSVPVGIMCCVSSDDHPIQFMNKIMCSLMGYQSVSEYVRKVGESALAAIHSEDLASFMDLLQEIKEKGRGESAPFRLRKKDFTYLWVQVEGVLVQDHWFVFCCTDHTEHKEEMEALIKTNDKINARHSVYRTMLSNMPIAFHRCRLRDPIQIDYVSDGLCQLSEYTREEIMGDMHASFLELLIPEDRHVIIDAIKDLMSYPHMIWLKYNFQRKDGTPIPVVDCARSVRDDDGMMWVYSVIWDCRYLPGNEEQTEKLAREMPCGFATYEYDGKKLMLLHSNDEFAAASGYRPSIYREIAAENAFAFIYEEDIPQLDQQLSHVYAGATHFECDLRINGKRGIVPLKIHAYAEKNQNENYILRIYTQEIAAVLAANTEAAVANANAQRPEVVIRTFGYFEVFVNGKPVYIRSSKAREMLALLVDRRGGFVSPSWIIANLWEGEEADKTTLTRCRKTYKTLIDELKSYGIDDIVESYKGQRRVVPERFECDLYDYCTGKPQFQYLFKGSYLTEYSWSEVTLAELLSEQE